MTKKEVSKEASAPEQSAQDKEIAALKEQAANSEKVLKATVASNLQLKKQLMELKRANADLALQIETKEWEQQFNANQSWLIAEGFFSLAKEGKEAKDA